MNAQTQSAEGSSLILETSALRRWSVVIFGTIASSVGIGIIGLSTTVFTAPMATDLGWERGIINYAHAVGSIAAGLGMILFGRLLSRFGIRIPTLIGLTLFGVSLVMVGIMPNSSVYLYATYLLYGIAGAAATAMPWAVAIVNMFDRNRGFALAIVISGSAIGLTVVPQFAGWLQAIHGWRVGYIVLGVTSTLISLTAVILAPLPHKTELLGTQTTIKDGEGSHFGEIIRDPITWKIIIAIVALTIAVAVAHPNIAPMMADKGLTLLQVTTMLSASGLASWAARLTVGPAMDRIHAPYVAVMVMLCPLIGAPLLVYSGSFETMVMGAMLIGIALGGEADMISFITSRYFSKRLYSQAVGIIYASWAWGISMSHVIAGSMFNYFQSYDKAILISAAIGCIGIPAILSLGQYREKSGES